MRHRPSPSDEPHNRSDDLFRARLDQIMGHVTPVQMLKRWKAGRPDLFKKQAYDQSGLDT